MPVNRYTATTDLTKTYRYIRALIFTELTGTGSARYQLRNGADSTNDAVFVSIGAPAGGTSTWSAGAKPLHFPKGVRLEVGVGSGALVVDGY